MVHPSPLITEAIMGNEGRKGGREGRMFILCVSLAQEHESAHSHPSSMGRGGGIEGRSWSFLAAAAASAVLITEKGFVSEFWRGA